MEVYDMSEIVCVFGVGAVYKYKPMGVSELTQDVKNELDGNKSNDYCIAQMATLTAKEGESPDANGYYTSDQIDYEVDNDSLFIKKKVEEEEIKFYDYVADDYITIP
jgi:hypothetical protein